MRRALRGVRRGGGGRSEGGRGNRKYGGGWSGYKKSSASIKSPSSSRSRFLQGTSPSLEQHFKQSKIRPILRKT
jgi:hypothetical protein